MKDLPQCAPSGRLPARESEGAKQTWVAIARLDDIPMRGARVVKTPHGCIAVFRTAGNDIFAIDDKCPHKGGPLSQGIVHGRAVTCPLHNWAISLETGQAQGADKGAVKTHALKIEGDCVMLDTSRLRDLAA